MEKEPQPLTQEQRVAMSHAKERMFALTMEFMRRADEILNPLRDILFTKTETDNGTQSSELSKIEPAEKQPV